MDEQLNLDQKLEEELEYVLERGDGCCQSLESAWDAGILHYSNESQWYLVCVLDLAIREEEVGLLQAEWTVHYCPFCGSQLKPLRAANEWQGLEETEENSGGQVSS